MTAKSDASPIDKFKKSTAKFARNQVNKTAAGGMSLRILLLEIGFAVAVGLTLSYGYIYHIL
jgi:hypothetical protein